MTVQVYSVPGQRGKEGLLEWKSIDFYLLHVGLILTIAKVFIILFLLKGIGNILTIFKINKQALLSVECSGIFSSWSNWRGEEGLFWRVQEARSTLWYYSQEHFVVIRDEKVSSFVKFEIILPLLCILLDPLTNKHCRTWSPMINLWIDSRTYEK